MKNNYRVAFSILSIFLVFLSSLSTTSKSLHDYVFHSGSNLENLAFNTEYADHDHSSQCSQDISTDQTNQEENCESLSCPVILFSNGTLALEYVSKLDLALIVCNFNDILCIEAVFTETQSKGNLVRGPPSFMKS